MSNGGGNQTTALAESGQSADETMSSESAGSASHSCPTEKTWIKIQLIGEDDKPIPGEKYRVELPDGSTREGTLDAEGIAGFEEIDPGTCKITFPDLDQDAWEPIDE